MKAKLVMKNQVEVLGKSRQYYFTKQRGTIIMDIFDAKIKDMDRANIGGKIWESGDEFNASRWIGKKTNQKVKKMLGI